MALGTYTELKTAIATFLHRDDASTYATDLVTLGEARLNRELRLLQMEQTSSVTLTSGNNYASLPTGFLDLIDFWYNTDLFHPAYVTIQKLEAIRTTSSVRPQAFAISNRIEFDSASDATYTMTMRHFKKFDIASDSTNWLLTNHPNAYLYTCLAEAVGLYKDDKRIPLWEAKAQGAMAEVFNLDSRARGKVTLRADDALLYASSRAYDINRDA